VYLGGGTPTVLSTGQFSGLNSILRESFSLAEDAEYTVEANPGTLTEEKLLAQRKSGANRLSIGVQSFSDRVLRFLGRAHTAADAEQALLLSRQAGFRNIGLDLMYGIPGQTPAEWADTLRRAVDLGPEHISAYSLSLDEGSFFTREADAGRLMLPEDGDVAAMYEQAVAVLDRAGLRRYEVSNFSRPGFECRHNLNYWDRGEYLGLGPGAWSSIAGRRWSSVRDVEEYCRMLEAGQPPISFLETADPEQAAAETLLLGLRTASGVDLSRFEREYGRRRLDRLLRNSRELQRAGLVACASGRLQLTRSGVPLGDELLLRLWA
jgi:oxygen-independent coproporphyrinogen-3 oxidase